MAVLEYSYQYKTKIPLLTESEFEKLAPKLDLGLNALKRDWKQLRMKDPTVQCLVPEVVSVLDHFEELYGHRFKNFFDLYNVRASKFGRPCPECQKPFRTPKAKLCVECGFQLPEGEVAGAYPI